VSRVPIFVFTYAPAGLGHLRVADALFDSRPTQYSYVILGIKDDVIRNFHNFSSNNPLAKRIFEFFQYGLPQEIITRILVHSLHQSSQKIYHQLEYIILQNPGVNELVIISTHFGLAHQICHIKSKLEKISHVKITTVVVVTDDTSQHIWCVPGADLTFVPSQKTKQLLENYAASRHFPINIEVSPYPLSPALSALLPPPQTRLLALTDPQAHIHMSVPVSGAAVGLTYLRLFIFNLHNIYPRIHYHAVSQKNPYTGIFFTQMHNLDWFHLHWDKNDSMVVNMYEKVYQENIIHLEITKPSEQAFKCLLSPNQVGGSILLFMAPVGRQEKENLDFLHRHELIPSPEEEQAINTAFLHNQPLPDDLSDRIIHWRALNLPKDPITAAKFVNWAAESGIFSTMTGEKFSFSPVAVSSGEVSGHGSQLFWDKVDKLIPL
jgi:hypothetical protein